MQYLQAFSLPSAQREDQFFLNQNRLDMTCYRQDNVYPFRLFPEMGLQRLEFAPITILYGGNGSGKSTLLNVMAQVLGLQRSTLFNTAPLMKDFPALCHAELCKGLTQIPMQSKIITSDEVFDHLLDHRAIMDGIDRRREALFTEYEALLQESQTSTWHLQSLSEIDELKRRNDVNRLTKSQYVSRRMRMLEAQSRSNGESAYLYFTDQIRERALYLLDEPENSLSANLQKELAGFLEDSARFYDCQLVISTHSPFLLAIPGAKIYDLDVRPVCSRPWTELENVRVYREFFLQHNPDFI